MNDSSKKKPQQSAPINQFGPVTVGRDFIAGDVYITLVNQIGAFAPSPDLINLRKDYLAHLQRTFHALDFKGIPQLRSLTNELALEEVYVPLLARPELPEGDTWERRLAGRSFNGELLPEGLNDPIEFTRQTQPVQIETALYEKKRVVVLGDPGSGKTTTLKHLVLRLARDVQAPLPILLPLNAYSRTLAKHGDINLQQYLADYYVGRAAGVAGLEPLFKEALIHGKAIILLDGLDEVQNNRAEIVQRVETFAQEVVLQGNRVLVTSRIVGYRDAPLPSKEWTHYTLLDFNPDSIKTFVRKWCISFEKGTLGNTPEALQSARAEEQSLLEAIKNNPGVERLASNPLLLTILALIKRQGVELPKNRIKLYDRYLETLIEAWNRASALDKTAGRESMDYETTLEILRPLALRIREENPTAGLVSARELQNWLTELYSSDHWGLKPGPAREKACGFLDAIRHNSNLLVERGEGQYGFIHLTFEEALAAYGLVAAGQINRQKSIDLIQKHLCDPFWHETILLSVGVLGLVNRQPRAAGEMVRALLSMSIDEKHNSIAVLMAGACLEDLGENNLGVLVTKEVRAALLSTCRNRSLPPVVQRDAGFCLGRTGWTPPDLDEMILIPSGDFLYGDHKEPRRIEHAFEIGKYPVTNLQFSHFIDAGGYENRDLWSETGWAWRCGTYDSHAPNGYQGWLSQRPVEKRIEPFFWHDSKLNNPLAPVVGVTWFEAEAYSNWLTQKEGKSFRLPTELEWERAARGTKGREFAWGNEFSKNNLNGAEFWSGQDDLSDYDQWNKLFYKNKIVFRQASTTIVYQFLEGCTPEDVFDLSGNVWEWTSSWYEKEQVNRVLCGGSWSSDRRNVRGANRFRDIPVNFFNNLGFRLLSPVL